MILPPPNFTLDTMQSVNVVLLVTTKASQSQSFSFSEFIYLEKDMKWKSTSEAADPPQRLMNPSETHCGSWLCAVGSYCLYFLIPSGNNESSNVNSDKNNGNSPSILVLNL
ncbi:hypothetical protein GOODEAATRI_026074 [Goodea atripinnis]|uniref:Uncharacterized protein n=1 Tax=Goodea atripinnis TaxID=208336 RepID=A0ABV0PH36_9TELE